MNVISGDNRFAEVAQMEGGAPKNMCEVLDRVEQKGIRTGEIRGEIRGAIRQAREDAMRLREKLRITDPGQIADLVQVDREQVEKWFKEKPM